MLQEHDLQVWQRPRLDHCEIPGPPPARIAFQEAGHGEAPAVLFLHGVGGLADQWRAQIEALAIGHRCLAPYLRGHGPSETTPGPYGMERLRGDLLQFLHLRGVKGPVDVVGHSYGGIIALDLALSHPEMVRRVVLAGLAEQLNFGTFFQIMARIPIPDGVLDLARRIWFANRFHANVSVLRAIVRQAMFPWQGWEVLGEVEQPVLLLGGQFDVVAPPHAIQALADRFPHAEVRIIPNVRHKIQIQNAAAVNKVIAGFLQP